MIDLKKVRIGVLDDLRSRGLTDEEIENFTPDHLFNEYCDWLGFIGWGPTLISSIDSLRDAFDHDRPDSVPDRPDPVDRGTNP